ncbi:MAG: TetR family transcriptional regulator C-terminal domain-containing protein [Chlamydiota bacterium]
MNFESSAPPKGSSNPFLLTFQRATYILVGMLAAHEGKRRLRDPGRTRERLLQAAFREMYRSGFQSAGIETILAATNVTKGALYHHFGSKEALGHAVIEEIIAKSNRDKWLRPLCGKAPPLDILIGIVQRTSVRRLDVEGGCPLLNLAQEMSPLDEQFRKRLARIFHAWQEGIAMALRRGQAQGTVRRDLNPEEAAGFLIATYEGYVSLAKNAQDARVLEVGIKNIVGWLRSLRAPRRSRRGGGRMSKTHVVRQRQRV